jgi:hypothetical protein
MGSFFRSGHFRVGPSGEEHWVEGHWVTRDAYGGDSSNRFRQNRPHTANPNGQTSHASGIFSELRRFSATWNTQCPVCDARVYYYQNRHGSRVFFDSLGVPWPKHPCTDIHNSPIGILEEKTPVFRSEPFEAKRSEDAACGSLSAEELRGSRRCWNVQLRLSADRARFTFRVVSNSSVSIEIVAEANDRVLLQPALEALFFTLGDDKEPASLSYFCLRRMVPVVIELISLRSKPQILP